jgi:hypothetical protein
MENEKRIMTEMEVMLAIAEGYGKRIVLERTCENLIKYLGKEVVYEAHVKSELNVINAIIARDYATVGKRIPANIVSVISRLNVMLEIYQLPAVFVGPQQEEQQITVLVKCRDCFICRGDKFVLPGNE